MMLDEIKDFVWVAGVVNRDPEQPRGNPSLPRYTFFEIDTTDINIHNAVLFVYQKFNINVCSHRIGQGYHYFGDKVPMTIWREWYKLLEPFNKDFPPLTLRISKKKDSEVFDKPIWHNFNPQFTDRPNWAKAILYYLYKVVRDENPDNLKLSMAKCGLHKYWKCVTYKVEIKK